MAVSDHLKPGLGERTRAKIITVDTTNRRVEAALKDGSPIHIAVWEPTTAFRWPKENEEWIVRRDSGIWMLDRRVQQSKVEGFPVTGMAPGDLKLDATRIFDANGTQLFGTGGPIDGSQIIARTVSNLKLATNSITAAEIANRTITATQIANGTISAFEIANGTITATQIANNTISAVQIANNTITASQIAGSTITSAQIANGTIGTAQIANGAVTTALIGAQQVTSATIANGTVTSTQIANGTITTTQISNSAAITGVQIAGSTITAANIAANTITASQIAANTITASQIAANTITASQIAAGTVTTTEIAANTIVAGNIAAATITGGKIAASTITASNLSVSQLSAITADLGSITAGTITGATIQTTSANPKVIMNSTALSVIDGTGTTQVYVHPASGLNLATGNSAFHAIQWRDGSASGGNVLASIKADKVSSTQSLLSLFSEPVPGPQSTVDMRSSSATDADNTVTASVLNAANTTSYVKDIIKGDGQSDFLQLLSTGKHKLTFGTAQITASAGAEFAISHGLGVAPVWSTVIPVGWAGYVYHNRTADTLNLLCAANVALSGSFVNWAAIS